MVVRHARPYALDPQLREALGRSNSLEGEKERLALALAEAQAALASDREAGHARALEAERGATALRRCEQVGAGGMRCVHVRVWLCVCVAMWSSHHILPATRSPADVARGRS